MPVDDDINLDDPNGITSEDIRRMNEQADELERIANNAENNSERILEAKKKLEGMTFAEKNLLDKMLDDRNTKQIGFDIDDVVDEDDDDKKSKRKTGNTGDNIEGMTKEEMADLVIDILKELENAKKERKSNTLKIDEGEKDRAIMKDAIKNQIRGAEGNFNEFMGATRSPIGFAKGRLLRIIGKAGIVGIIITAVHRVAETLWKEYMKSFEAGGANDIRKLMEDRDRELAELDDILSRRAGRVFFTGDVDLRQGAPQFSNTERLRDQVIRYQALHLGE